MMYWSRSLDDKGVNLESNEELYYFTLNIFRVIKCHGISSMSFKINHS